MKSEENVMKQCQETAKDTKVDFYSIVIQPILQTPQF